MAFEDNKPFNLAGVTFVLKAAPIGDGIATAVAKNLSVLCQLKNLSLFRNIVQLKTIKLNA